MKGISKGTLKKIIDGLLKQKQELLEIQKTSNNEIDTEGDETDSIQANLLIDLNNQLNTRNAAKLAQINSALKRIEDNVYGICEECEEQIPEKRLLINPYFQTCVSCAEDREAEEKQRKRL